MARYKVRLHTRHGVRDEEVEARDPQEAEVRATKFGTVLAVSRVRGKRMSGLTYSDRQTLLSRLSAMLASGVGATESLTLLRDTFGGRIRHVAHELLLKVEAGMSVPEAIVAQGGRDFPSATAAMVQAGANAGATSDALRDAMDFENRLHHIRKESSRGIWMALFTFVIGIVFVIGTVFWMVPAIMSSALMQMTGGAENFGSTVYLATILGYVMVGMLAAMVLMFLLATVGRQIIPRVADGVILRIPVYKDVVLSKNHYIAFYGLGLLVKTGVRMEEALRLMADSTKAGALREDFKRASAAVKSGQPWAPTMKTLQPTDRAALGASLNREQVARALEAISTSYRDMYAQRVALLTPILQVLAAVGLILSGLVMFGLTVLPVLKMSTQMLA